MTTSIFDIFNKMLSRNQEIKVFGAQNIKEMFIRGPRQENDDGVKVIEEIGVIVLHVEPEIIRKWLSNEPQVFGLIVADFQQFKNTQKELEYADTPRTQ